MDNISFMGIPVSREIQRNFTIYKLTPKVGAYINTLAQNINHRKCCSGLTELQYDLWEDTTKRGLQEAFYHGRQGFLLAKDGNPCGIMNITPKPATHTLNFISTWTDENNKRIPFAGKTLFAELFKNFLNSDAYNIELTALKHTPFNAFAKYLQLGFKPYGGNNFQEMMRIKRNDAEKSLARINQYINLTAVKNGEDLDLFTELNTAGSL